MTVKYFVILCLLFVVFVPILTFSANKETNVNLKVETGISPVCDQDGICEPVQGETEDNCFTDCGCNNNGICDLERLENSQNCPSDCPAAAVLIPDTTPPTVYDLFIEEITSNSVTISWKVNEQALCRVFWGRTQEYEEGVITENGFSGGKHSTKITNLLSNTTYHFKVSCKDTNYNESETADQRFTTLVLPDITPPANVSDFEAIPGDKRIILRWKNPPDKDFKEVKIFRSTEFYPTQPWEGSPIYIGSQESFEDIGLTNGITYYYTAFSYDKAGNFSSGAIVSATPKAPAKPPVPPQPPVKPPVVPPPPEIEKLKLEDFDFFQAGRKLPLTEKKIIKLKEKEPLTISIDYEKVPEVLKSIMVTLEKENKYFSFLLRINREKTKYLATLVPPGPGIYSFTIHILDFKNQTLKSISGQLEIEKTEVEEPEILIPLYKNFKTWIYILILVLGAGVTVYILRRKHRKKLIET